MIAFTEESVFKYFIERFDISNKKILEVGGAISHNYLFQNTNIDEWVSIDPANEEEHSVCNRYKKHRKECIDYSKNEYFDFIFSANAFEHINNFRESLSVMYDNLKRGGVLFAHFGPIWSAPDGHHLSNIILKDGTEVNFWINNPLPKWFHLLYKKSEMHDMLLNYYEEDDVNTIISYIFYDSYLNRLTFKDYISCFIDSGFNIEEIRIADEIDYDFNPLIPALNTDEEAKRKLISKYGNNCYECRDMLVVLKK